MIEVVSQEGKVVNRSQNLRGLRSLVGREPVNQIRLRAGFERDAYLLVIFDNQDWASVHFVSRYVLVQTLVRWRNLQGVRLIINGHKSGRLSADNQRLHQFRRDGSIVYNYCDKGNHQTTKEVRRLPIGQGAAIQVCLACYRKEMRYRKRRNKQTGLQFSTPGWLNLEITQPDVLTDADHLCTVPRTVYYDDLQKAKIIGAM